MPDVLVLALILLIIVGVPIAIGVTLIFWITRGRGWGSRPYFVGMVIYTPLVTALFLRYVAGADRADTLKYSTISFVLAIIYAFGLAGWEQFFKERRNKPHP